MTSFFLQPEARPLHLIRRIFLDHALAKLKKTLLWTFLSVENGGLFDSHVTGCFRSGFTRRLAELLGQCRQLRFIDHFTGLHFRRILHFVSGLDTFFLHLYSN